MEARLQSKNVSIKLFRVERKLFHGKRCMMKNVTMNVMKAERHEARDRQKVKCRAIGAASDFLKAMANPVRLSILCALVEGARSVTELEAMLDVHQPTLSQQLGELREAGIIVGKRSARAVIYRLADPRAGQLIGHLRLLFADPDASAIWRGTPVDAVFNLQM
ncbi:winged helix-turn-helix transcriptional regulator [Agrobacterium rhizogenes]|nr:putative transcriptional regulator [Rhizobium sp. AP16]NTF51319.1 winged helix-turn-helix transcriptional regulator [Rhizobium rhizogenes]OCJ09848.1 transcriptional regulator [Agrobacterium sp. B131/95]NTF57853.1 winged helix-turn-helix transcriptional regulator [Rhizobium rhizogenes]NTF64272.1 winged helix-turn-helix transcriptional regulator [Rhizobium rhizogenes]